MSHYNPAEYWDEASKDPDVWYKYIADSWAKPELFTDYIKDNNSDWGSVLEIGCGMGRLLTPLADEYTDCKFYGIDISQGMMEKAPKRKNVTYGDTTDDLDLIYSMLVFQHITTEDKKDYLELSYRLLKDNGILLVQFVMGTENSPYSYQLSVPEFVQLLELAGFTVADIQEQYLHDEWCFIKAIK